MLPQRLGLWADLRQPNPSPFTHSAARIRFHKQLPSRRPGLVPPHPETAGRVQIPASPQKDLHDHILTQSPEASTLLTVQSTLLQPP